MIKLTILLMVFSLSYCTLPMPLFACEKDNSFGCVVWETCVPVYGGWDYIGDKK